MSLRFVDPDALLRAILRDHPAHSPRAVTLLERVANGEVVLRLATQVFYEVAFVLFRRPHIEREAAYSALETLLEFDALRIDERRVLRESLRLSRLHNVPFVDAYLVASMAAERATTLVTFDHHIDRFPSIERVEP